MKLKPIPKNTIVHTPTEEEAKELLAILHENGYKWWQGDSLEFSNTGWCRNKTNTVYEISCEKIVFYKRPYDTFKMCDCTILTLAKFKERYADPEATVDEIISAGTDLLKGIGGDFDDKKRIEMLAEKMIDSVADGATEAEVINAAVFVIESIILQMKRRNHMQLVGTIDTVLLDLYGFKADSIEP